MGKKNHLDQQPVRARDKKKKKKRALLTYSVHVKTMGLKEEK